MELDRIAELRLTSRTDGLDVVWDYFGGDSKDEQQMRKLPRHRCVELQRSFEGQAAEVVLNLHHIPTEAGEAVPPGFGFARRTSAGSPEVDRPARELLSDAIRELDG